MLDLFFKQQISINSPPFQLKKNLTKYKEDIFELKKQYEFHYIYLT